MFLLSALMSQLVMLAVVPTAKGAVCVAVTQQVSHGLQLQQAAPCSSIML